MAVPGYKRSKENCNAPGLTMTKAIKAPNATNPPLSSHFHASPSPSKTIPNSASCTIEFSLKGSEFNDSGGKKVSPMNMNNANRIRRPLRPRTAHLKILMALIWHYPMFASFCSFSFNCFTRSRASGTTSLHKTMRDPSTACSTA